MQNVALVKSIHVFIKMLWNAASDFNDTNYCKNNQLQVSFLHVKSQILYVVHKSWCIQMTNDDNWHVETLSPVFLNLYIFQNIQIFFFRKTSAEAFYYSSPGEPAPPPPWKFDIKTFFNLIIVYILILIFERFINV